MTAQLVVIVIAIILLGVKISDHGKLKGGRHNWLIFSIHLAFWFSLLYIGGFFDIYLK
tara:strand:+ start:1056 stop:1229 length:174 start_codon:yes stop_codon:yes gene_type:complete